MPNIAIDPQGTISMVYDDTMKALLNAGEAKVYRASHVEPDAHHCWTADLTPVGGPVLGSFLTRAEALDAEVTWLNEHIL